MPRCGQLALAETPKPGDARFARVENRLIAGGWQLLDAAAKFWRAAGDRAVRDEARARETAARYPDGYLPDGRRIVVIDNRAA